jgi:putative transposase
MNNSQEKKMREMAAELALDLKTPEDLSAFSKQLKKIMVEAALGAEMEYHLGYARNAI